MGFLLEAQEKMEKIYVLLTLAVLYTLVMAFFFFFLYSNAYYCCGDLKNFNWVSNHLQYPKDTENTQEFIH